MLSQAANTLMGLPNEGSLPTQTTVLFKALRLLEDGP